MDDYAGRVLADRYRLPLPPSDEYEFTETRAFDTYSGQEVLVRQVPLPEVVEAEVLDAEGLPEGFTARERTSRRAPGGRTATRQPADPAVRRAVEAAQAAARIPDHPRLDQVFDVFAEGGSLWIVSELVAARPLAALLTGQPLSPYRAAEVASDVLMALRVLHAHGWVHRNITVRTVLVCDDGRVMLTGLAAGAAEEALCGYDPVPAPEGPGEDAEEPPGGRPGPAEPGEGGRPGRGPGPGAGPFAGSGGRAGAVPEGTGGPLADVDPEAARRAAIQARAAGALPAPGANGRSGAVGQPALETGADVRAARAGAIAAYRAGARAAARVHEARESERPVLPGARPPAEDTASGRADTAALPSYPADAGAGAPPGRIADPYGVRGAPWHGAAPRAGTGGPPPALGGGVPRPALPGQVPGQGYGRAPEDTGSRQIRPAAGPGRPGAAPARDELAPAALPAQPGGRWDEPGAVRRGPGTALAAERARQVRMTVVGPVTERWAPEQAGPVHENWQLAAPIGPATDLWALGALLFRAVQGHAPYPEESTAELVQLVCAEPPAFAEECGPLRPVVESLLRQDPIERPDVEELSGWLRSLVRSAPEPDAGSHVVPVPPADPNRLPIIRRRGELVRRRRAGLPAAHPHGRHKRGREQARSPRSLGRTLLLLILLLLAGVIAYAMLFMPKQQGKGAAGEDRTGSAGQTGPAPAHTRQPSAAQSAPDGGASAPATETQTGGDPSVPDGFTLRKDPDGFRVAVAEGWERTPKNGSGQVAYAHGNFELIVVPGRDGTSAYGSDPMVYQRDKEPELQPYRDSSWATATGLRTIEVGGRTMAEGQFTWTDGQGRDLFVRNMALLLDGRYHVVQVRGPEAERDEVTRLYEQATATYRYTG
ncbi:protein kinase [Streptomyces sp. 5-8]|uniref:Protein kinase n=1 Tax=Streptomyces musisoli TaxID=2802280 RepID=A0ABS1P0A0_9ACTN|nr:MULTISPECIES: protein kinase [Streptomyces]MBL1105674.1 protein kinase [Streptomyces musisoli]MBY8845212.1 protein kinase [Streptomyces sp. SP2-10]